MTANLFSRMEEDDRRRLLEASWTETLYCGQTAWMSPDKKSICSQEEALKRLEREQDTHG